MANFTPNYNLKKPLGSESYNVADQNGNMEIIDTALNGIDNGLAIVSTGDTHAAITAGQYVYVRRHDTLSEGLYKANSNIAANATLTSSNLSSVSGGLGGEVSSLNSNLAQRPIFKAIGSLSSSSPITLTFSGTVSFVLFAIGFNTARMVEYLGIGQANAACYAAGVLTQNTISVDTSVSGKMKFTKSDAAATYVSILFLDGSPDNVTVS